MRVMGIDPDTKAITSVILDSDPTRAPIVTRLEAKGRRAEDRIEGLYKELFMSPPQTKIDWVYIESPVMGVNAKALSYQAQVIGMIRYWLWYHDLPHSLVNNGTWKKNVLGNGHASKEEIAAYAQQMLEFGSGELQDIYDAALIAEFGLTRERE
jgi:Holliday junction resolvasome RuvABC endonuclease subunit